MKLLARLCGECPQGQLYGLCLALAQNGQGAAIRAETDHVFTVPWSFSNDLRIEINMVAGPTCTTEPLVVDPGDELRLQIMSAITGSDFCR